MDKSYVSEFELFMEGYMKEHPEEVEKMKSGWRSDWEAKIDPASRAIHTEDYVPDHQYGFH